MGILIELLILLVVSAEFGFVLFQAFKRKPDVGCDICKRIVHPRFLKRTVDKKFWACTRCRKIYKAEVEA